MFGVFLGTVAALMAGAVHPEGRVWGFNHWAYWGSSTPWILAGACIVLFALAGWVLGRGIDRAGVPGTSGIGSWLEIVLLCALFGFLFLLARSHYHFLGDGYQTIALLAADPPTVKGTAPLLRVVLPHVRAFFDEGEEGARRIYQLLSIGSGVVFILSTAVFARLFFSSRIDRLLFVTSSAAGGFALLFFGYVENYAPLSMWTAITFLTGIAIFEGKLSRLWILPPAFLMMGTHVFGVLVFPTVAFVFLSFGPVRRWLLSHRPILWILLAGVAIGGVVAARIAFQDIRVQLAVIPVTETWYASDGHTLFSRKHFQDLANLIFLLFPGLALCTVFALLAPSSTFRGGVLAFCLIFTGSLWTGIFLLRAGLGMPRDWDLFAFAGVPLVLFASLWVLRNRAPERRLALAGAIVLGIAVLGPRVVEARNADVAILHFRNYLALDRLKGRSGYFHLVRHYRNIGREDLAREEIQQWEMLYPERGMMREADGLYRGGNIEESIRLCREVLAINPAFNEAYMVLGEASLLLKDYETARMASIRAFGLLADRLRCTYNAGLACAGLNDFPEAEKWLRKALEIASDSFSVNLNYAVVCKKLGRMECYEEYLARAAACEGADPQIIEQAKKLAAPAN